MAFVTEKEELKPGLIIFRRGDVEHRMWYCRMKMPKADRYKTVSLKTSDKEAARERAFDQDADEHGTPIIFYKQLPEHATKDEEGTGEGERVPFVLCHYTVFNVEQCDGLALPEISQPAIAPEIDEDELCESIVMGWENRPALHLTSPTEHRAYYRRSTDSVHLPTRSRFVDTAHYYSTFFHELIHSTGHESRLNRTFGDRFGDELYSKEELVAEMGAAFLCAIAGIANEHTDRNTTAYIQNWIEKLEEDNRLIVHAAANAQRAVDMILGSTFEEENETNENAGDAAVSGIPAAVAVNIAPAIYGHTHL